MIGNVTGRNEWLRRVGAVVIAALALWWLFRRVDVEACWHALQHARPGWLLASIVVYGLGLLPAAGRWHLMLRLARLPMSFSAALRLTLIGHWFYFLFFGAVGGDAAKSALAARWHRLPLPEVLSASPLDRLAAFGGLILLAAFAVGIGALEGAFADPMARRVARVVICALVVMTLLLVSLAGLRRHQPRGDGAFARWWRTTTASFDLLFRQPKAGALALSCGLLQQVSLSGALALNLAAVADAPVPWAKLAWCLPLVWMLSGVPVTIAGLGFREGAAVALLGLYGINAANAAAASLLVVPVSLAWAVVGAGAMWRPSSASGAIE